MAHPYWDGSQDGDFNTASNWSNNTVPGAGDGFTIDDRAAQPITLGLDQSAISFVSVVVVNTRHGIGTSANPFKFTKINDLDYHCTAESYFHGDIDNVNARCFRGSPDSLVLDCTFDRLNLLAGNCRVIGTRVQPAGSVVYVAGHSANNRSVLTLADSNVDMTTNSVRVHVSGTGKAVSNIDLKDVVQSGGLIMLEDSADGADTPAITGILHCTGGRFSWGSSGNIADAQIGGSGILDDAFLNRTKTLTSCTMYDDGAVELANSMDLVLPTGGIIVLGENQPIYPIGSVVDVP